MNRNVDLSALERQAYRSNFADGLWDIFLGCMLLQTALGASLYRLDWSPVAILAVMLGFVLIVLALFTYAKKHIVTPRMGMVMFGEARKAKNKKLSFILSLTILLGVLVFIVAGVAYFVVNQAATTNWTPAIFVPFALFAVLSVVIFSVAAYLLDYPRAYLYGWFFGLSMPLNILLDELFGISLPLATALFSAVMILIGLILFVRFLQTHPIVDVEV